MYCPPSSPPYNGSDQPTVHMVDIRVHCTGGRSRSDQPKVHKVNIPAHSTGQVIRVLTDPARSTTGQAQPTICKVSNPAHCTDQGYSVLTHPARDTAGHLSQLNRTQSNPQFLPSKLSYNIITITSLVLSHLDYCNAILAGLPASTLMPLQRAQNAATRLVLGLDHRSSSTTA